MSIGQRWQRSVHLAVLQEGVLVAALPIDQPWVGCGRGDGPAVRVVHVAVHAYRGVLLHIKIMDLRPPNQDWGNQYQALHC